MRQRTTRTSHRSRAQQVAIQRSAKPAIFSLLAFAGAAGAAYLLYRRFLSANEAFISPQVGSRLPLAKNLGTIDDGAGNYDIDGVSFDTEGVVIASDNHKSVDAMI